MEQGKDVSEPSVTPFDLVIFDCDGVLVDSELVSNRIFAEMLGELGLAVSIDFLFERFVGHSMAYCLDLVRGMLGRDVPAGFLAEYRERTRLAFVEELQPVAGIHEVLAALTCPSCVASSGDHTKMRATLGLTGLLGRFEGRLFSATQVSKGKPAPDVFLFAAAKMGAVPERVAVVEDTPVGVTAGSAAGMTVFGYSARTPASRLRDAGAAVVFTAMHDLPALLAARGT
jgi:HAD superfamily hydrolase (TIGR01509 family)